MATSSTTSTIALTPQEVFEALKQVYAPTADPRTVEVQFSWANVYCRGLTDLQNVVLIKQTQTTV